MEVSNGASTRKANGGKRDASGRSQNTSKRRGTEGGRSSCGEDSAPPPLERSSPSPSPFSDDCDVSMSVVAENESDSTKLLDSNRKSVNAKGNVADAVEKVGNAKVNGHDREQCGSVAQRKSQVTSTSTDNSSGVVDRDGDVTMDVNERTCSDSRGINSDSERIQRSDATAEKPSSHVVHSDVAVMADATQDAGDASGMSTDAMQVDGHDDATDTVRVEAENATDAVRVGSEDAADVVRARGRGDATVPNVDPTTKGASPSISDEQNEASVSCAQSTHSKSPEPPKNTASTDTSRKPISSSKRLPQNEASTNTKQSSRTESSRHKATSEAPRASLASKPLNNSSKSVDSRALSKSQSIHADAPHSVTNGAAPPSARSESGTHILSSESPKAMPNDGTSLGMEILTNTEKSASSKSQSSNASHPTNNGAQDTSKLSARAERRIKNSEKGIPSGSDTNTESSTTNDLPERHSTISAEKSLHCSNGELQPEQNGLSKPATGTHKVADTTDSTNGGPKEPFRARSSDR